MPTPKLVQRGKNFAVEYWDHQKGHTTRESLGTDEPGLATKLYAEWCLKHINPKAASTAEVYIEGMVAQFYHQVAIHYPSKYAYKSALAYCSKLLEGVTLKEFDRHRQDKFVKDLEKTGLSRGTVGRILGVIGTTVQRAYEYGEITEKPFILCITDHARRERTLTDEEARALLNAPHDERERRYLLLAFCTAARPQALMDLSWEQFDLRRQLLDLNPPGRPQNVKKYRPTIPIPHALMKDCQLWGDGPIFPVVRKNHTTKLTNLRPIAEKLAKHFPEGCTPYVIRHTVATELRAQGVPEFDVSGFLGHKPPGVSEATLHYAKYRPGFMRKAADAIDNYWGRLHGQTATGGSDAGTDCEGHAGGR